MKNFEVRVFKLDREDSLKGVASVTIDDDIVIRDIKIVMNKDNELFINMPQRKVEKEGLIEYRDITFFMKHETREQITNKILEEYKSIKE